MPIGTGEGVCRAGVHLAGGGDIQQRKSRNAGRMVEGHAMGYARAPIMCAHSPGLVPKRLHGCNEVRS